jgi:hypothetical protein
MRTSTRLAAIALDAATGELLALGALWREKPIVLAFVRHFG